MKKFYTIALAAAVAFSVSAKEVRTLSADAVKLPRLHTVEALKGEAMNLAPKAHKAAEKITIDDVCGDFYWTFADGLENFQETTEMITFEKSSVDASAVVTYFLGENFPIVGSFDEATGTVTIPNQDLGAVQTQSGVLYAKVVALQMSASGDSFGPAAEPFKFTFSKTNGHVTATADQLAVFSVQAFQTATATENAGYFFFAAMNSLEKDAWTDLGNATLVDGIMPAASIENAYTITSQVLVQSNVAEPTTLRLVSAWTGAWDVFYPEDKGTPNNISPDFTFSVADPDFVIAPLQQSGLSNQSKGQLYWGTINYLRFKTKEEFFASEYKDCNATLKGDVVTFAAGSLGIIYANENTKLYQFNNLETTVTLPAGWNNGDATAVEEVEVEAGAPVEYFNLQGVRVANPENGLYIRRQGKNVTKVLVK